MTTQSKTPIIFRSENKADKIELCLKQISYDKISADLTRRAEHINETNSAYATWWHNPMARYFFFYVTYFDGRKDREVIYHYSFLEGEVKHEEEK